MSNSSVDVPFKIRRIWFNHDDVPPHFTVIVREFCQTVGKNGYFNKIIRTQCSEF